MFVLVGFLTMLLLWGEGSSYLGGRSGLRLVGVGVGLAGTPASRSLTGSVPVTRAGHGVGHGRPPARPGRRDHAVDLRGAPDRRLCGRGAAALAGAPPNPDLTTSVQNQLTMSFAGAAEIAAQYPQYSTQIIQAAKEAFLAGDQWAYLAGIVAVLLGATLVFFKFPRKDEERRLLASITTRTPGRTHAPSRSQRASRVARVARPHEHRSSKRWT